MKRVLQLSLRSLLYNMFHGDMLIECYNKKKIYV